MEEAQSSHQGVSGMWGANDWVECARRLPPNGVTVLTKVDDAFGVRNEQKLKRQGLLWFLEDHSMYVCYRPTHWKVSA